MRVERDFEEFIELLNKHRVQYVIIGAFAVTFHSRPRNTGDIDFLIGNSKDNIRKLMKAVVGFGFGDVGLKDQDFLNPDTVIQLRFEPNRIDILTEVAGMKFGEIYKSRVKGKYGKQATWFISRENLIRSKKVAGRKKDEADLELLIQFKNKRP